jgi:hypothetical protein
MTRGVRPGQPAQSHPRPSPEGQRPFFPLPAPSAVAPSVSPGAICIGCDRPIQTGGVRICIGPWLTTQAHRDCAGAVLEALTA